MYLKKREEIKEMCEALAPFKAAVDALDSEDADLLLSEKVIAFVLKKLGVVQPSISKNLIERFSARVNARRNDELMHLYEYLKKSSYIDQPEDHLGHKICRPKMTAMATRLLQRLFATNESDEVDSSEEHEVITSDTDQETQTQMTLAQELRSFVADDKNEEERCNNVSFQVVKKEMRLYEVTNTKPNNLEKLYAALKTIKPTSVEAERAFLALGYFVSKIRNRLNDNTIDVLLFLRHYYSK